MSHSPAVGKIRCFFLSLSSPCWAASLSRIADEPVLVGCSPEVAKVSRNIFPLWQNVIYCTVVQFWVSSVLLFIAHNILVPLPVVGPQ